MRRKLHVKWLLGLLGTAAVLGVGTHFLHAYQLQRNAGILLTQSSRFEEQGDWVRATAYLGRYLAYVPGNIAALAKYGELLEKFPESPRSRWQAAFVLEQVLRRDPKRDDVRRRLVRVAMELGRFRDADEHLDFLLEGTGRDDGELEALRGRCQEKAAAFEQAARTYRKSMKHAPDRIKTYVRLARLLRQRLEQPAEADAVMEELVKANPRSAAAYLARGRYRLAFGLAGASTDIRRARELAPDDADVYLASAQVLRREKKPEASRQLLEQALKQHPKDVRLYEALAQALGEANQSKEAVACLRRGLEAMPNQSNLAWALTEQLIEANQYGEASKWLARMGRAGFAPARLDYLQARVLMGKQQWTEAVRLLHRARPQLASLPDLLKQVEMGLGRCHGQLGDLEQQRAAYRRTIALDSRWLPPRLALGAALAEAGQVDEALNEYQQAAALPGAPGEAWTMLARARMRHNLRQPPRQQDWKGVERDLARAERHLPGSPDVTVLRAHMLAAQGQDEPARALLETARQRQPEQIPLWAASIGLLENQARHDQAQALLREATKRLGDTAVVRLLAAGYWSSRPAAEARSQLVRLAEGMDKFPNTEQEQLRTALADAYYRTGQLAEARQQWDELARRKPDDLRVRLRVFDLALEANDETALPPALAEIKRLEGSDGAMWRFGEAARRVRFARSEGKRERAEARALLTEVAARRPGWARVPLLEGEIAEQEKNPDLALEKYQRALEMGERQLPVVRRVVRRLYERHRYAEADQVLRRLQGPNELNGDLGRLAAELSLSARNSTRALELARQAVSPSSRDYRDHIWLGQVQAAAGKSKEAEESFRRALELGEKEPAAWIALVRYLAERKQPERAEQVLRQAKTKLAAAPASLTLANGYEALGKQEQAEASYRAVLVERPDDVAALTRIARFYLTAGRRAEAEPHLRQLLEPKLDASESERAFARRGLAVCLGGRGDYPSFQQALTLLEENAKKPIDAEEDRRARATVLATRPSRRREAIALLEELNTRQRLTPGDRFLLARLHEATKDWAKARSQMLSLLAEDGANASYLAYYADVLLRRGDRAEAEVWLQKLAKVQPRSFETIHLQARLLKARGQTDQAVRAITAYAFDRGADLARAAVLLEDLGQAPAAEPLYRRYAATAKAPEAVLTLALYLARSQKGTEALALCETAWTTCRAERVAAVSVDVLQIGRGDDRQTQKIEKKIKAVAKEHGDSPIFDLALGQLYYQRQRYSDAEARYRAALRQDPDHPIGLNNLAWLLTLRTGKPADALELVNRAIAKTGAVEDLYERAANSSVPNLLDTRAVIYLALGRTEAALKDLEPAVAATPTRNGYYHLALAHRMAHNEAAAELALRKAAQLGFHEGQVDPLERKAVDRMTNNKR